MTAWTTIKIAMKIINFVAIIPGFFKKLFLGIDQESIHFGFHPKPEEMHVPFSLDICNLRDYRNGGWQHNVVTAKVVAMFQKFSLK